MNDADATANAGLCLAWLLKLLDRAGPTRGLGTPMGGLAGEVIAFQVREQLGI